MHKGVLFVVCVFGTWDCIKLDHGHLLDNMHTRVPHLTWPITWAIRHTTIIHIYGHCGAACGLKMKLYIRNRTRGHLYITRLLCLLLVNNFTVEERDMQGSPNFSITHTILSKLQVKYTSQRFLDHEVVEFHSKNHQSKVHIPFTDSC